MLVSFITRPRIPPTVPSSRSSHTLSHLGGHDGGLLFVQRRLELRRPLARHAQLLLQLLVVEGRALAAGRTEEGGREGGMRLGQARSQRGALLRLQAEERERGG